MPFTVSHAAVVLPFLRARPQLVSGTALVIGSAAPDFEYFIKMGVNSYYSHTLLAIFYFNIPITILLAFLFHGVVKKNLIENLPFYFQYRFNELKCLDFQLYFKNNYWAVIISAGMGAASHIIWDSFTHNDGFFAQRISLYKNIFIPFDGVRYPLFYGLQQISTYVGLLIVIIYTLSLKPDRNIQATKVSFTYWIMLIVLIVSILFLRFFFDTKTLDLGNFVVSLVSAILLSAFLCGLINLKSKSV
jgi:hypothetical protein